jgi:hypothetical protein
MSEEQIKHLANSKPQKHIKKLFRKVFVVNMLWFIAGLVISSLITYFIVFQSLINSDSNSNTQTQATSQRVATPLYNISQSSPTAKSHVTDEEVKMYTDTKDCSTLVQYSKLAVDANRVQLKTIDLERGQINIQFFESTMIRSLNFLDFPEIVDYKCNPIKASDLKGGQTVRLYNYSSAALKQEPEKRSYIFLVQKITQ